MSLARMIPTAAFIGLLALVIAPVAVSLRMMSSHSQNSSSTQKSAVAAKATTLAGFDGERAYKYLVEQCDIGTRISGSDGNRTLRRRMAEHFESQGAKVTLQPFEARHPLNGQAVEMENVVAAWHPERNQRVVIGAHFDTRPHPDKEVTAKKKAEPFLGANDGASGIALLMELAHQLKDLKTSVAVDLVAFDGEELVYDDRGEYFLGSKHFAAQYRKAGGQARYVAGIVLDMVGGKSLEIFPDREGDHQFPQLRQEIWATAKRLKATGFKTGKWYDVSDDHIPLIEVGIPAIDIIDFSYRHWHLASDTADKCSAASLAQVGGVLAEWLRGK